MDFKFEENNIVQLKGGEDSDLSHLLPRAEKFEIKQADTPAEIWQRRQDALAEEAGLSILLVDGHQPPSLAVSNNNSVCRFFQSSYKYAHLCESDCGKAFESVQKKGESFSYRCHAGFQCVAVKLSPNPIRPLAAIVGRALTKVADYEDLLKRRETENWQDSPADELLTNLRFAQSEAEIRELGVRLQNLDAKETRDLIEFVARTEPNPFAHGKIELAVEVPEATDAERKKMSKSANVNSPLIDSSDQPDKTAGDDQIMLEGRKLFTQTVAEEKAEPPQNQPQKIPPPVDITGETFEDFAAWQLFIDVLLDKSFKDACAETLQFLTARYGITSLGWLERSKLLFKPFLVSEDLRDVLKTLNLKVDDYRLQEAVLNESSLVLASPQKIEVFPLAVGEDVRAAIVIGDHIADDERRSRIARFSRQIAVSLEVLRLREELARRAKIIRAVQIFSEKLNSVESAASGIPGNVFDSLLKTCAELLDATRGSLLLYDESTQKLTVQAAFGTRAREIKLVGGAIGERIAKRVWKEGKPIVAENLVNQSLTPAPPERAYLSDSFISFPLFVGSRAIGVLNLTDKRGAENSDSAAGYNLNDLDLLETIAPQLAIALDRASLQQKAGKFEQLSITDSLTGLLNRRYLDERLNEEVSRSLRDGRPMSFLMVDIDNFKSYNDRFGHRAGDEVLIITAHALKSVLRNADVAARFGGDEFCLLLPNTSLEEAKQIGERIREQIEDTTYPHRDLTVSIGVSANFPLNISPQEIIEFADKALYQAKRTGKNNVQLLLFEQSSQDDWPVN